MSDKVLAVLREKLIEKINQMNEHELELLMSYFRQQEEDDNMPGQEEEP